MGVPVPLQGVLCSMAEGTDHHCELNDEVKKSLSPAMMYIVIFGGQNRCSGSLIKCRYFREIICNVNICIKLIIYS